VRHRRTGGMTSQPTVLHVLEALCGGTARHLIDLVEWTADVRHVVAVPRERDGYFVDPDVMRRLMDAGAEIHRVDMRRLPVHPRNVVALVRLMTLAHRVNADIIHGHSGVGGALARVVPGRAARVYTPNGLHPAAAAMAIERLLGPRTDRFVAVSRSEGDAMTATGLARPVQVAVIPNGVDSDLRPEPIDLHAMLGLPLTTPLIGTVARLDYQKAPEHHLDVFEKVAAVAPEAHFVVIGDGPQADEVDRRGAVGPLARRLHRIPGLPGAAGALGSLRVFVLLSRYEGGPYAPLEAARAGVPLVLSDAVGNRDVVVPGESGELTAVGDAGAAAAAVLRLLDDGPHRTQMTNRMHGRLREVFSLGDNGIAHAALYTTLAAQRRRGIARLDPYRPSGPTPISTRSRASSG
jgi:glycosyltransferase involved in cell wall biosynthesis